MNQTVLLHYYPGARGDFLASVIFDAFKDGEAGSVTRPVGYKYKNIHITEDYSFLDAPDTINIRIASGVVLNGKWTGLSSSSVLQICHNWFVKHHRTFGRNPHFITMDTAEQYYHCAHFYLLDDNNADMHTYNYRVKFDDLSNIDYLNQFRRQIMGANISESSMPAILANLEQQPAWQSSKNSSIIEQVRQLIDHELESGVFLSPSWDHVPVADKIALLKE